MAEMQTQVKHRVINGLPADFLAFCALHWWDIQSSAF